MRSLPAKLRATYAAAFLAVALLTHAGVRSEVMLAQGALAPTSMPADCPMGMAMDTATDGAMQMGGSSPGETAPAKAHAICEFCVAAAQAPLPAAGPVLFIPTVVAWRCAPPAAWRSARGPPAFAPKARGPPISPLIV